MERKIDILKRYFEESTPEEILEDWKNANETEFDGPTINEFISNLDKGEISDGWHTFNELYEFRKIYNACLFNEWAKLGLYDVHKSLKHNDGELCFDGGWFIVVAILPDGQISNHYKVEDWNLFSVPEVEKAKYEFDGHAGADVLERLKNICLNKNE